jgi:DNA-binding response OmpR family regulator
MLNVLLVEDDLDLADTVIQFLELDGICCDHASNGVAGLQLAREEQYQVLILDLNLPRLDGLSLCKRLRQGGDDTPVLMLTARDQLEDKLAGFEAGTDDYLIKPFALQELVVRIQALSQRRSGQTRQLSCAGLIMDLDSKTVTRDDIPLKVTPTGWKLLEVLLRASPRVTSRRELEAALWGDEVPDSNSLKVHLSNLRKTIDAPFSIALLRTVERHGFVIREPEP